MSGRPAVGHRLLPHTADVVLEAWAPSRERCLAEAVHGLVAVFADTAGMVAGRSVGFTLGRAGDEELLVRLLEEVIYLVEVEGLVPVEVHVEPASDGGLGGRFDVVPLAPAMGGQGGGLAPAVVRARTGGLDVPGHRGRVRARRACPQPLTTPTGRRRATRRARPACWQVATTSSTSL